MQGGSGTAVFRLSLSLSALPAIAPPPLTHRQNRTKTPPQNPPSKFHKSAAAEANLYSSGRYLPLQPRLCLPAAGTLACSRRSCCHRSHTGSRSLSQPAPLAEKNLLLAHVDGTAAVFGFNCFTMRRSGGNGKVLQKGTSFT